jgi:multidrug efflux pump subunit AcrA (membrane-fusion protein)
MRLNDLVLDAIFWFTVAAGSTITVGTVLLILEDGLYLNKKNEARAHALELAKYEAEARLYREAERQRIRARNPYNGGDNR